jgi:hypothetical protein
MNLDYRRMWLAGYTLRARLYSIIVFLGLLPVLGVLLALAAFENARTDHGALDRAARGTSISSTSMASSTATVMESRGIYMSADWKSAEPVRAKN